MLARYLHSSKVDNYENYRNKPYKETKSGVGVHIALRPHSFMQIRSRIILYL